MQTIIWVLIILGISLLCGGMSVVVCLVGSKLKFSEKVLLNWLVIAIGNILLHVMSVNYGKIIAIGDQPSGISVPLANNPKLEGKVIRPLTVVKDGESALVIGNDHKLYSLLGVQLEPSLSVTNMVGKDLIIYKKGQRVCIGIKEPEVKAVPTQIGYSTNK